MKTNILRLACIGIASAVASAGDQPNFVVILVDDAGYADFGFTGCEQWGTPNIDALVAGGVVCTQGYVSASVCSPSRAGLLTGRYQQRFGHEFNLAPKGPSGEPVGLPMTETTIADRLGDLGYASMAVGKWHLGSAPGYRPTDRGFDEFAGLLGGSRSYRAVKSGPNQRLRDGAGLLDEPSDLYMTDWISDRCVDFIERDHDKPFFLYASYTAVHSPMHAKDSDAEGFGDIEPAGRRTLGAMTRALDRGVGRIVAALDKAGLTGNTVVFFLNDNGGATTNFSDNGVYRGMKGSKWEGGVRVPFAVRWPGVIEPGTSYDEPIISLDLAATMVMAGGGDVDESLDGVDLKAFLTGANTDQPHEMLFWRRGPAAAVRWMDWKLIRVTGSEMMLFNLARDVGETTNVAADHSVVVDRLVDALAEWERDHAEPLWQTGQMWRELQIKKHKMDVVGREAERRLP